MRTLLASLLSLSLAAPAFAADKAAKPAAPVATLAPAKVPAGKVEVTWWGHAAFVIRTPGGATIAVDPWLQNPKAPKLPWPTTVDAILVTHGHGDHVGNTIELAKKTGATVVGGYELVALLGLEKIAPANSGGTIKVKDATIHLVPAIHSSSYSADGKPPYVYSGAPVGYVIEIAGGPTLYHSGDTDAFSEMALVAERYHPSVGLLCIGGNFTMDPVGAAQAARLLKVKTVVPMHWGTFPMLAGNPTELRKSLGADVKVDELDPGKPVQF